MEEGEVNDAILNKEKEASIKVHEAFRRDEEQWRLKPRILRLQAGGDQNTSFFHKQAKMRQQQNIVS
jgi:hypothetical protein